MLGKNSKSAAACLLAVVILVGYTSRGMRSEAAEPPPSKDAAQANPAAGDGRTDMYGDPLPKGALVRLGSVRYRYHDMIFDLALSPDGKVAATAGGYWQPREVGTVRLWDMATGKDIRQLPGRWVTFSPDGKLMATGQGWEKSTIRILERESGKELHVLRFDYINYVTFSPDGKTLAYKGDGETTCLWDMATEKVLHEFKGIPEAFSPDGKELATVGDRKTIYLWDNVSGKLLDTIRGQQSFGLSRVFFSPDGKAIVTRTYKGDPSPKVTWWERGSGKQLRQVSGDLLSISPNGKLLALLDKKEIGLWDVAERKELRTFKVPPGMVSLEGQLSADGNTLVLLDCATLRSWDTQTGKELHQVDGPSTGIRFLAFTTDGKELISGGDPALRFWDVKNGKELRRIWVHETMLMSAALTADGQLLAATSWDGTLHFWNRKTDKHESIASWTDKHGPNIALSSEGKILASVNNAYLDEPNICIWDMVAQKTIRQFGTNLVQGVFVAFSPDGQFLADLSNEVQTKPFMIIRLWEVGTGKFLRKIQDLEFMNPSLGRSPIVAFSPNAHLLAAARPDKSVGLWEVHSGKLIRQLKGHEELPFVVTFSPNGRVLASGGQEGSIRLWDVESGRQLGCFRGHRAGITALAFSPDGGRLASGCLDGTSLIWEVTELKDHRDRLIVHLEQRDLEALWADLGDEDAAKAYQAISKLTQKPKQTVPFLKDHLPKFDQKLSRLITDLDSDQFDIREKAFSELEKRGRDAEWKLRETLAGKPTEEFRRIAGLLLEYMPPAEDLPLPAEQLRSARGVEILERIATTEAREALDMLAKGGPKSRLTVEAKASLERLIKLASP